MDRKTEERLYAVCLIGIAGQIDQWLMDTTHLGFLGQASDYTNINLEEFVSYPDEMHAIQLRLIATFIKEGEEILNG